MVISRYGVVQDGLAGLGVGDEVRRDVALVELHALGELEFGGEGLGLLDGDDAVLADLGERLADELADRRRPARRSSRRARSPSRPSTGVAALSSAVLTASTAASMPRLSAAGVGAGGNVAQARRSPAPAPARSPWWCRRRRRRSSWWPPTWRAARRGSRTGSSSSISRAIVTPSLVMTGGPNDLSMTTLRPLGPSVTLTVSASLSTPRSSARRASSSKLRILAIRTFPIELTVPRPRSGAGHCQS